MGMSAPEPIQVSEALALCSMVGIASNDDRSKYLRMVQKLDRVYREHWHDTNKA